MVSIQLDVTFFIQMGLFLFLVYVLNVLIYKPISKVMAERDKKITGFESDAKTIEEDLEGKLADYKAKLNEAKEQGSVLRTELKKTGLEKETEVLGAAHSDALATIENAKKKIEAEKEAALESLKNMAEEMGKGIAEKALGRSL